jgi:4-hydroxythreonine-4-phosphate dehydrogenase
MREGRSEKSLLITQGEPSGIGPELLLRLASEDLLRTGDRVFAGAKLLEQRAVEVGAALPGATWPAQGFEKIRPHLEGPPTMGQVEALERAVSAMHAFDPGSHALVTAPIDKANAAEEGLGYPGHTEFLAARASVDRFAMMMAGPRLRVVLATIHVPLAAVPTAVTSGTIVRAGRLLAESLVRDFEVIRPRIGVLGLNPHAGERGTIGDEEQRTISPAIAELGACAGFARFIGPLPADTAFPLHAQGELDGIVAMYHDQGLGPFKLMHFHEGVNVTLGLPYVRTSPDHGTAIDLAGKGTANPSSMYAAIRLARGPAHKAWPTS